MVLSAHVLATPAPKVGVGQTAGVMTGNVPLNSPSVPHWRLAAPLLVKPTAASTVQVSKVVLFSQS